MMNHPQQSTACHAYHHLYEGKTLLLKISGKELEHPNFRILAEDITAMTRYGVKFLLICGAGEQNTKQYHAYLQSIGQQPGEPQWIEGRRFTSLEELEHGVLPASQAIRENIARIFPEATILTPQQIHCRRIPELGYVGIPEHIEGLASGNPVVALSVGCDGENHLNIGADETTTLAAQSGVNEVIFFTPTGGVMDTTQDGKIAPLLWAEDIATDGRHKKIDVTGGGGRMQKKLCEAKRILDRTEKVVITGLDGVRGEIEHLFGKGTMIAAKKSVQCRPIATEDERTLFSALYDTHALKNNFIKRTPEQQQELQRHVHLIGVSNSILGAFALIPRHDWMELAAICSEYNGTGVGDILVQSAQKMASAQNAGQIYSIASSTGMAAILERNGFTKHGTLEDIQKQDPDSYFHLPCVSEYDVQGRGRPTYFCTWQGGRTA